MKKSTLLYTSTLLLGIGSLTFFQTRTPDNIPTLIAGGADQSPELGNSAVASLAPESNEKESSDRGESIPSKGKGGWRPVPPRTWDAENLSGQELENIPYGVGRVDEVVFEELGLPDHRGLVKRTRVLKTDFHFPLVQTVELLGTDPETGEDVIAAYKAMVADHVMVQVDLDRSPIGWREQLAQKGISPRREITPDGLYIMGFPLEKADGASEIISSLQENYDWVRFAEPDLLLTALAHGDEDEETDPTPSDPEFEEMWGLDNTGQMGLPETTFDFETGIITTFDGQGVPGFDINALDGWKVRTDASNVIVAVLDSGVDYTHPDLQANMWVNPKEGPTRDGLDNSGSGYIDDIHGVDLVTGGIPMDNDGHGTHVAGTIGAVGNNDFGVTGVAWDVQLMAVKILSPGGTMSDIVRGIDYAWENGAHVLNNSWGVLLYNARLFGTWRSEALADSILRTRNAGAIFVTAAGNDAEDVDVFPSFPADHQAQSSNVVNVAAINRAGQIASFSNYGVSNVQVAAPGHEILSTWPGSTYLSISGTSMAAPHVSGMLALLRAEFPNEPYDVLIQRLYRTSVREAHLASHVQAGRLVDLGAALSPAPLVYAPLVDTFFVPGVDESATLTVGASGKGVLTYKWFKNGVELPGETGSSLEFTSPGPSDMGNYTVEILNADGKASSEAGLRISVGSASLADALGDPGLHWFTTENAPWVAEGDTARSGAISHGEDSEIRTAVAGPGSLTFTWKVSSELNYDKVEFLINGDRQGSAASGDYGWANERTVEIPAGEHVLAWRYSKDGSTDAADDAAWLRNVTYVPYHPVVDFVTPSAQIVSGSTLNLSVEARGPDLEYFWKKNGAIVSGENGSTLALSDVDSADAGSYSVTVRNSYGVVTRTISVSLAATAMAPTIFHQPQSVTSVEGEQVVLWADFEATYPWTIQWYKDGLAIEGAQGGYLNVGPLTSGTVGSYSYTVTNDVGSDVSQTAAVKIALPIEDYGDWLARFGGLENAAQASGDGVDPLLRFALGVEPGDDLLNRLPKAAVVPGPSISIMGESGEESGSDHMALVFERPTSIEGVVYGLEASTDLNVWEEVDSVVQITDLPGGEWQSIRLMEASPLPPGEPRRFLRMKVDVAQ